MKCNGLDTLRTPACYSCDQSIETIMACGSGKDESSDIICPFCHASDFDLVGLKNHLQVNCEPFRQTEELY